MATPISSTSCTGIPARARSTSESPNVSAYCSEARAAKPTSDAARNGSAVKMRRRLRMVHTMRIASANDGGTSSWLASSPRSAAARSKWPRPGSRRRRPATTRSMVGTANT